MRRHQAGQWAAPRDGDQCPWRTAPPADKGSGCPWELVVVVGHLGPPPVQQGRTGGTKQLRRGGVLHQIIGLLYLFFMWWRRSTQGLGLVRVTPTIRAAPPPAAAATAGLGRFGLVGRLLAPSSYIPEQRKSRVRKWV